MMPDELDVVVTTKHLNDGSRTDLEKGPLSLAVADALAKLGIEVRAVKVREEDVVVYEPRMIHHTARYWMDDDAWRIVHRHRWGARVKARTVTLTSIYIDRHPSSRGA